MKRTLLVGIGQMGKNHAKVILSDETKDIELTAVCDADPARLTAFRQDYPDIPVFLIPKDGHFANDALAAATAQNIQSFDSVADIIRAMECDTLVNATHNRSHVPVLEDAFQAHDTDGAPMIKTVFQEKPFAHDLAEAERIAAFIDQHDITFNLNGILTFSPIWKEFIRHKDDMAQQGFQLKQIKCSYGKDRTRDTRPAQGGWVGMEAIHALDISTAGLKNIHIDPASIKAVQGFLAEKANDITGDGIVSYATECQIHANLPDGGAVAIEMEGSYAWDHQVRRVQYIYENEGGQQQLAQLDFDVRQDDSVKDRMMTAARPNAAEEFKVAAVFESGANKLAGYYNAVLDPQDTRPLYDIPRALAVQQVLEDMGNPASIRTLHSKASPKKPAIPHMEAPPRVAAAKPPRAYFKN